MDAVVSLYSSQPFWFWLGFGAMLLAVESALSTEWLLWPAAAAGVVAIVTALGVRLGLPFEIGLFAILTLIATLASRRLVQRVNPADAPDINARDSRLIGQRAKVVEGFVDGRGRVFVSGSEWPAEIDGAGPDVGESVIVDGLTGSGLKVRTA